MVGKHRSCIIRLKETVACIGVHKVKSSNQIMVMETQVNSTIFTGKGDADTGPSIVQSMTRFPCSLGYNKKV